MLVLYLFDLHETGAGDLRREMDEIKSELHTAIQLIPIGNKADKENSKIIEKEFHDFKNIHFISAKDKINIDEIIQVLLDYVNEGKIEQHNTIVTNARHAEELRETSSALARAYDGLEKKVTNDFIAGDLRLALHHLGMITGEISTDDLLENIFSKFCIGK